MSFFSLVLAAASATHVGTSHASTSHVSTSHVARGTSHVAAGQYDVAATQAWRVQREQDLRSDSGWLTVAGLFFLKPGPNAVGSNPSADVVLPNPAPPRAGVLVRDGARIRFEPYAGVRVLLDGKPIVPGRELTQDDRLTVGDVSFQLHRSGDRLGVRVRNPGSALRTGFAGLSWYPIQPSWSIAARFVAYPAPRPVAVPNVAGDYEELVAPGEAVFELDGREIRLQAAKTSKRLWFIFSDALSGRETFRIRFLYADVPGPDGIVTLDFNRAYNPPCAFNPYTTCPLPPPQNRLPVGIAAGEKIYKVDATLVSRAGRR
jgi:uncharacterized protein (DUF1684 family)